MQKRLLLVDDEPRNLAVLEAHLAPLGHELITASDGRTALELVAARAPDLVLLDLMMPGFDGIDVLTHIRARPAGDHLPVILVTAHSDREHRLRGLEAGADEFLEKPIDGSILLARVRTLLQLKDAGDALRASRDELAIRNDALQQLQREQRELMAFIVHDLKNPLSVVLMSLEYALDTLPPEMPHVLEALVEANLAARRLRTMTEDLLAVSRLEEAQFTLHNEPIVVAELLREVIHEYVRRAEEKHVSVSPPADDSIRVTCDRSLLQRVIENILDNSLRHAPENGRVSVAARAQHGIEIAVSNNGPPIPREHRRRIFEKFARGDQDQATRGNAGLGLYFCKRAIEALGGVIDVEETAEWPTSFVVRLPLS